MRSKSTRLTKSGVIVNPHFGQVLSRDANTLSRLSFRDLGIAEKKPQLGVIACLHQSPGRRAELVIIVRQSPDQSMRPLNIQYVSVVRW
jgi:hypothetical protein